MLETSAPLIPGVLLTWKGSSCQHWITEEPLIPSRAVMFKAGVVWLLRNWSCPNTPRRKLAKMEREDFMLVLDEDR